MLIDRLFDSGRGGGRFEFDQNATIKEEEADDDGDVAARREAMVVDQELASEMVCCTIEPGQFQEFMQLAVRYSSI